MRFFMVSDNTSYTRGFPWAFSITEGLKKVTETCSLCKSTLDDPIGDIRVLLERDKGTKWPDILGCGHYPLLIVSQKVIEAFNQEQILDFPYYKVMIEKPFPKKMKDDPGNYYWIDGAAIFGAHVNFEASGFVGNKFCPKCHTRSDNISQTYEKQKNGYSIVFKEDTWNGKDLFTTDISHTAFFCTERVVNCAKKYKLTNFCFIPVEQAGNVNGIKYM